MDKDLITELRLPRVKILPKSITGFIKENIKEPWVKITELRNFLLIFKDTGEIYSPTWCLFY